MGAIARSGSPAAAPQHAPDLAERIIDSSPAVAPPPGNPRFPMVEAMRGIAVLLVLMDHTFQMSGATDHASWGWLGNYFWVGVILFFAISGFLLYRPFVVAHAGGRQAPTFARYARRRLLRILPAYWVALTLLALWPGIEGPLTHRWWVYYGFMQVYSLHTLPGGLPTAWSLCIEVTFYVLLPFFAATVAALIARGGSRPWWHVEVWFLSALWGVGVLGSALVGAFVLPKNFDDTLFGCSDYFALGMGLAVLSVAAERGGRPAALSRFVERWSWLVWTLAVGVFLLAARAFDDRSPHRPATAYLFNHIFLGFAAVLLLAPAVLGARGLVRRIALWRPLSLLGLISYGVFLWHFPLAAWLGLKGAYPRLHGGGLDIAHRVFAPTLVLTLATLAASVVVATISYRVVELPFLRLKEGSLRFPFSRLTKGVAPDA